jgi:hypothetical protein
MARQASVPVESAVASLGPLFMEVCIGSLYISWKVTASMQRVASFDIGMKDLTMPGCSEDMLKSLPADGLGGKAAAASLTQDGDWFSLYVDSDEWKLQPKHSYQMSVRGITPDCGAGEWVSADFFFKGSRLWQVRSQRMKMKLVSAANLVRTVVGLTHGHESLNKVHPAINATIGVGLDS